MIKLAAWSSAVNATGLPWLICADWNATPEELENSGWVLRMDAVVIKPVNTTWTCANGGRLIDYVVAGGGAQHAIQRVEADNECPSTHKGISIKLSDDLDKATAWRLPRPKAFVQPPKPLKEADPNSKRSRKRANTQTKDPYLGVEAKPAGKRQSCKRICPILEKCHFAN